VWIRWTIGIACAAVVAITIARGVARAADWALLRQDAAGEWHQRGPMLEQETACRTALASDGIVVPAGTRMRCERVVPTKETRR
jgi:hypothetical protein